MPPSTTESNRAIHNDPVGHDLSTVDKLDLGSELEALCVGSQDAGCAGRNDPTPSICVRHVSSRAVVRKDGHEPDLIAKVRFRNSLSVAVASLRGFANWVSQLADFVNLHCHDLACLEPSLWLEAEPDAKRSALWSSHTHTHHDCT